MADELPEDWQAAIARIAEGGFARIVVLGPTDVGKSSFVRALVAAMPGLA